MKTRDDMRNGCAELLKNLRKDMGVSKSKMAEMLYIDQHTWSKYETGQSVPSVIDFLYIFSRCNKNALRPVLTFLYPEYMASHHGGSEKDIRKACIRYVDEIATDHELSLMQFILMGTHGSSTKSQINEFAMIDHLPMEYRYAVAQMVDTLYEMALRRGELVCTDIAMPDVDVFRNGLTRGKEAAAEGRESYAVLQMD